MQKQRAVLLTVLLIFLVACSSKEKAAEAYFAKGMQWYEQGEWAKARVEFGNAIQKNPQFAKAYYYTALVANEEANIPLMYENLSLAIELDENNMEAILKLAELQVVTREFEDALKTTSLILKNDAQHYDALRVRSAAYLGMKNLTEAEKINLQLLKEKPNDASVLSLQSVIMRELGQIDQALEYLEKAIAAADKKSQYRLVRVALNKRLNDWLAVEEDMKALVQENPNELNYSYSLAKFYLENAREKEAQDILENLVVQHPQDRAPRKFLLESIFAQDKQAGFVRLQEMISRYADDYELRLFKVQKLFEANRINEAEKELQDIIADPRFPNIVHQHARVMLAENYFAKNKNVEAMNLLNKNMEEDATHEPTLLVLAEREVQQGETAAALAKLNSVLSRNPDSEPALLMLGQVYMATGSPLLADDSFRQVLELNPSNADAAIPVVRNLMQSDDLERSENIMTETLRHHPNDVRIQTLLANILLAKKHWQKADAIIGKIKQLPSHQVYGEFLQGRLLQGRKHYDMAIQQFSAVLEQKPDMIPAIEGIAQCYLAMEDTQGLLDFLQKYSDSNPSLYHGYAMAAQYYQGQKLFPEAIKEIEKALQVDPTWLKGYASTAGYKTALGDTKGAISGFRKGIAFNKQNVFLKVLLADYLAQQGMINEARNEYQEILDKTPDYVPAINNFAVLLLRENAPPEDKKQALILAEKLKESSDPHFLDTYGWALYHNDEWVKSERYLRQAATLKSSSATILYHQAKALQALDRVEEARQILQRAERLEEKDTELKEKIKQALLVKKDLT